MPKTYKIETTETLWEHCTGVEVHPIGNSMVCATFLENGKECRVYTSNELRIEEE